MGVGYNPKWTVLEDTFRHEPAHTPSILIQVESGGYDDSPRYYNQRILIDGNQVLNATSPRSYRATRLYFSNGWKYDQSNGYDVYGSQTEADNLNTFLNTFQTGDILVLNTNDEPNNRRTTFRDILVNSFYAKLQYSSIWEARCSYQLIAVCGKGNIYEAIEPRYSDSIRTTLYLG